METPETPPTPETQPQPPAVTVIDSDAADIVANKDIAAFGYLWIMCIVVFLLRRNSPFVRFHTKQAMILFVLSILVLFIPVVSRLLGLGVLALMVLGFINAAQGHRKDIPIVGPLSRREIGLRDAWKQFLDGVLKLVAFMKSFASKKPPSSPSSSPPSYGV